MEVKRPILRDDGGTISDFRVEEGKTDFCNIWGREMGFLLEKHRHTYQDAAARNIPAQQATVELKKKI